MNSFERKIEMLYFELLYAVATKHPNESRHQTALRYIRQAEEPSGACAMMAVAEKSGPHEASS